MCYTSTGTARAGPGVEIVSLDLGIPAQLISRSTKAGASTSATHDMSGQELATRQERPALCATSSNRSAARFRWHRPSLMTVG